MSAAADRPASAPAFSPKVILALVLVGIVAFAGLAVLSAYAPDLRNGQDGAGARAVEIGDRLRGRADPDEGWASAGGQPQPPASLEDAAVVLTPEGNEKAEALQALRRRWRPC